MFLEFRMIRYLVSHRTDKCHPTFCCNDAYIGFYHHATVYRFHLESLFPSPCYHVRPYFTIKIYPLAEFQVNGLTS